jgi:hypothetical protein
MNWRDEGGSVRCGLLSRMTSLSPAAELLFLLCWLEDLEGAEQTLVHAHHGTGVVELAAVVGGAEQRNELTLGEELIAILNDLMRTADEVHVVFLQEARDNVGAEREGDATVVLGPARDILVGVRPQQVAEETAVRDLERKCQQNLDTRARCLVDLHQSAA